MANSVVDCCRQLDDGGPVEDDECEDEVPCYKEWGLPSQEFHRLWESLHYETNIKRKLLHYAQSALLFADRQVDPRLICWNR